MKEEKYQSYNLFRVWAGDCAVCGEGYGADAVNGRRLADICAQGYSPGPKGFGDFCVGRIFLKNFTGLAGRKMEGKNE